MKKWRERSLLEIHVNFDYVNYTKKEQVVGPQSNQRSKSVSRVYSQIPSNLHWRLRGCGGGWFKTEIENKTT